MIVGAGIAGTTLAYWLNKANFEPVVLEYADAMRSTGQAVELSTTAVKSIGLQMGLSPELLKQFGTGEQGLTFVDDNGATLASFGVDPDGSFTSEFEILRSELVDLIYKQTKDVVEYRFGDRVSALAQHSDGVSVEFESGKEEEFALVIVADGLYSRTRKLAAFQNIDIRHLGIYTAFFTIENEIIGVEDRHAKWYTTTGSRNLVVRPDRTRNSTRVFLSVKKDLSRHRKLTVDGQKEMMRKQFTDCHYLVDQVLDGMDRSAKDYYMTEIAQIRCDDWTKGRVVLCGDAAYCPSPISGMGTDTAILGAYVLAGELSKVRDGDYQSALQRYQEIVGPFVKDAQNLPPGAPGIVFPKSSLALFALQSLLRVAHVVTKVYGLIKLYKPRFLTLAPLTKYFGSDFLRFFNSDFELPHYDWS